MQGSSNVCLHWVAFIGCVRLDDDSQEEEDDADEGLVLVDVLASDSGTVGVGHIRCRPRRWLRRLSSMFVKSGSP